MHDGVGAVGGDGGVDGRGVGQIALDEDGGGVDGGAMPLVEIVEDDGRRAVGDEPLDGHAADVAGPAGDEYFHDCLLYTSRCV